MNSKPRLFIAGHRGLVGSAVRRVYEKSQSRELCLKTRQEVDLLNQKQVHEFFEDEKIDEVVLAAAKVGGIVANNTYQADFLYENLMIECNVIHAAAKSGVKKLLFLGSTCIYPKHAPQPIKEESLLTSELEPTNEGYAIAKIAGLKLCEHMMRQYGKEFISCMPTNLYGPGDNFHPENSHVIPGMMRRFHEAKVKKSPEVVVWGTGKPRREFLYVDDLGSAIELLMNEYHEPMWVNVGTGEDCTISDLAMIMKEVIGFEGKLVFDSSRPDGTPRKLTDVSRLKNLGWTPSVGLRQGLEKTYRWALENEVF